MCLTAVSELPRNSGFLDDELTVAHVDHVPHLGQSLCSPEQYLWSVTILFLPPESEACHSKGDLCVYIEPISGPMRDSKNLSVISVKLGSRRQIGRIERCELGEDRFQDASDQVMDCFGCVLGQG